MRRFTERGGTFLSMLLPFCLTNSENCDAKKFKLFQTIVLD